MSIEEKIEAIYNEEKNVRMESFWDNGWKFSTGDSHNGFTETKHFEAFAKGVDWLYDKYFPDTN